MARSFKRHYHSVYNAALQNLFLYFFFSIASPLKKKKEKKETTGMLALTLLAIHVF